MTIKGITCYTDIHKFKRNNSQLSCYRRNKDGIFFQLNGEIGYGIVIPTSFRDSIFRAFGFENLTAIRPKNFTTSYFIKKEDIPIVWMVITLFFNNVSFDKIFDLCGCNEKFTEEEKNSDKDLEKKITIFEKVTTCITERCSAKEILKLKDIKNIETTSSSSIIGSFKDLSGEIVIDSFDAFKLVSRVSDVLTDNFGFRPVDNYK